MSYGYNADGDTTSVSYPLPATATWASTDAVTYGYSNADVLNSVTDFAGNEIPITSNADGLPTSETLGSTGDTITTSYDSTDHASAITLQNSSSALQSFAYSDAPDGDILSETDTPSSSQSPTNYTYDAQGRVTSMTPGTGSASDYEFDASSNLTRLPNSATGAYDAAGELTSSTLSGTTTNYTYNADGEQLTAAQGSTNISAGTWDGAGQLTAYSSAAANMTAASYDGDGMRASSTIVPAGSSAATQDYVWNIVPQTPQMIMDSTSAYIYGSGNTPIEQVSLAAGTVTYLVADSLGSVRGTVNNAGILTGTTSYGAWGSPESTGGLTATTPFGFAGGYADPDGLIYLLSRYYDPATGQFISVDPDLAQTLQPYTYAGGNPVNYTDPTGAHKFHWTCGWVTCTAYFGYYWTERIAYFGVGSPFISFFAAKLGVLLTEIAGILSVVEWWTAGTAWEALGFNPPRCLYIKFLKFPVSFLYPGTYRRSDEWCGAPR